MKVWTIQPLMSVGPLALDSSRADLESVLGDDYTCFSRGRNVVIAYDSHGLHIESDHDGKLRAITVFHPCHVSLNGIELLGRQVGDVKIELDEAGLSFEAVDTGLWSEQLLVMIIEVEGIIDGVEVRRVPY